MTQQETSAKGSRAERWKKTARRIRVPLGFATAALYLFEVIRQPAHPAAIAWSLALVVPGLALRAAASGTVRKNRKLAVTGPYAYTRNPLYLGSILIAAGFAVALLSWLLALVLAVGFALIYIPVIASEEQFLRATFPGFDDYCRSVPRLIPRLIPLRGSATHDAEATSRKAEGGFSFTLYLKHREYNSALGAALLYLSLLFLRPVLELLIDRFR